MLFGKYLLKDILFMAIVVLLIANAHAATSIPPDVAGIWATDGSEFRGYALLKGQALYLDTDGIGASVGGDGKAVAGVRILVTSYNPNTKSLNFDLTENSNAILRSTLTYDPIQKTLFSPKDSKQRFRRRFEALSADTRKSLGLELKAK